MNIKKFLYRFFCLLAAAFPALGQQNLNRDYQTVTSRDGKLLVQVRLKNMDSANPYKVEGFDVYDTKHFDLISSANCLDCDYEYHGWNLGRNYGRGADLSFSYDNNFILFGERTIFDVATGKQVLRIEPTRNDRNFLYAEWSPSKNQILLRESYRKKQKEMEDLVVFDFQTPNSLKEVYRYSYMVGSLSLEKERASLQWSPNGNLISLYWDNLGLVVINPTTNQVSELKSNLGVTADRYGRPTEWFADNKTILLRGDDHFSVIDTSLPSDRALLVSGIWSVDAEMFPDRSGVWGTRRVSNSSPSDYIFFDFKNLKNVTTLRINMIGLYAVSPTGRYVVYSFMDDQFDYNSPRRGEVWIYDTTTNAIVKRLDKGFNGTWLNSNTLLVLRSGSMGPFVLTL